MKRLSVIFVVLVFSILTILIGCYRSSYSNNTNKPIEQTVSINYRIMGEMNALGFAVSVTNYEDVATKISSSSLTSTQRKEASYIKTIADKNKGRMILGLLTGGIQMVAWTDGTNGTEFYFRPR